MKFAILSKILVKNFSLVTFLAPEPRFMPNLKIIPYLLIKKEILTLPGYYLLSTRRSVVCHLTRHCFVAGVTSATLW